MVRVLFLVLLGSFWIISGAETHHIIHLEISKEPRIVIPKFPQESLFLDETLNVRILSETPVEAKVQILLCYVGEERPSYSFASILVESKIEKNNFILDHNLRVRKGMKGIWYCTLLFDRDPILFQLEVYVTSPNEVSREAEIVTETGFYSNGVTPPNIHHDKRYSATIKRDTYGNEARLSTHTHSDTEPDTYDNDGSGAESQIDETNGISNNHIYGYTTKPHYKRIYGMTSNTNKLNYGYGAEPQNTRYGRNSKRYNQEPSSYSYNASPQIVPQVNETNRTIDYNYWYRAATPQNIHFDYETRPKDNPKKDSPHTYADARNNLEQPENVEKDNDESAGDNKMYVFIAIAAGSGILIGTIVGVLFRRKCKTPDNEPIVNFTTADPVYDDVYSANLNMANRLPHPLPFEEREENKQYIHYDTPYDHRCGWKRPPQVVTFTK